jgi:hypothetical protein
MLFLVPICSSSFLSEIAQQAKSIWIDAARLLVVVWLCGCYADGKSLVERRRSFCIGQMNVKVPRFFCSILRVFRSGGRGR